MKRRRRSLSQAKKLQLSALHRDRVEETRKEIQAAIKRMSQGVTQRLQTPIKWTLENLATEAARNVATLHRIDGSSGRKVFEGELIAFSAAKEEAAPPDKRRSVLQAEQHRRKSAEAETKAKEVELVRLFEQNLELANRVRVLEKVKENWTKSEAEVQTLRAENEKLKFQLLEVSTGKRTKRAPKQ